MAKVKFINTIASMQGKVASKADTSFRTRAGKSHSYILQNPYKGPLAESRKAAINVFRTAVTRCSAEMNDPERLAFWTKEYERYQRRKGRRFFGSDEKKYSTLRGFIIAKLSEQIKAEQQA